MFRRLLSACAVVTLILGLTAAPARAATPVEAQLTWLVEGSARLPLPAAEVEDHLAPELLTAAGGAEGFNALLASLAPLTPGPVLSSGPDRLRQVLGSPAGEFVTTLVVDASGKLAGLQFTPHVPAPASWAEIDAALDGLAPRVSFAVTRGGCDVVHGRNASVRRPLGSIVKVYVLSALAEAVAAGRRMWDSELALREDWKSLPSGVLQDQPAGTTYTLAEYARHMMAISDNTATDHLIHTLGRPAVERELAALGNAAGNRPLLTTRNLFTLKGWRYPSAADAYRKLPAPARRAALTALDRVPRERITPWTEPRRVESLEWFGSPLDICRAYASLWQRQDPAVHAALSANDGGLALPAADFPDVWFKGGSEPGVLALSYLVRTAGGEVLTASLMLSDPDRALDEATVAPRAIALLRGAFTLAAANFDSLAGDITSRRWFRCPSPPRRSRARWRSPSRRPSPSSIRRPCSTSSSAAGPRSRSGWPTAVPAGPSPATRTCGPCSSTRASAGSRRCGPTSPTPASARPPPAPSSAWTRPNTPGCAGWSRVPSPPGAWRRCGPGPRGSSAS